MKIERTRPNVFTVTATSQELAALVAAARMALDGLRNDPAAPAEALELLERVVQEYDVALGRLRNDDGRSRRPSEGSRG